ncbi:MAG: hypothetical protein WC263_00080 [Candidatus Micrarchaeia archaeon]|jgi:hypothetical protein
MKKFNLVPSFQWVSASTFPFQHGRPTPTSGKLVRVAPEFLSVQPLKREPPALLSRQESKWSFTLMGFVDFVSGHEGSFPSRKSADKHERDLANWWRLQAEKFNAGRLSAYQVGALVDAGLAYYYKPKPVADLF